MPNVGICHCCTGILLYLWLIPRGSPYAQCRAFSVNFEHSGYNEVMARGWESKSVEEQMAAGPQQSSIFSGSAQDLKKQQVDKAHHARKLQELNLKKEFILTQRTSNPGRRAALEAALAHIEAEIQALN
jgi:hypothetical protein